MGDLVGVKIMENQRFGRFAAVTVAWFCSVACTTAVQGGTAHETGDATLADVQVAPDTGDSTDASAGQDTSASSDDHEGDAAVAVDTLLEDSSEPGDTAAAGDVSPVEDSVDVLTDAGDEPALDVEPVVDTTEASDIADDSGSNLPDAAEQPDSLVEEPPDTGPSPEDVGPTPDTATCVPDCVGKVCGPDGCGGSCGSCQPVSGGQNVCLASGAESCLGRCGQTDGACACDDLCASLGDCCVDYLAACVAEQGAGTCATICNAGKQLCGGACVAAGTPTACGAECTVCAPPSVGPGKAKCSGGVCGITCNAGYHRCGDACMANGDAEHCGTACLLCPGPPSGGGVATCELGICAIECDDGYLPCEAGCCEPQITFEQVHDSVDATEDLDLIVSPSGTVHVASYEDLDGAYHFERTAAGEWVGEKLAGKSASWKSVSLSLHEDTGRPYVAYATDDSGGGGAFAWVDDATGDWKSSGPVKGEFTLDVEDRYTMFGTSPSLHRLRIKDTKIQYGALTLQDAGAAVDADVSREFIAASYAGALAVHRTDAANWVNIAYYVVWQGTGFGRVRVIEDDATHLVYEQSGVLRSRTYLGPDIDDWSAVTTLLDPKPSLTAALLADGGWDAAAAPGGQVVVCYYDASAGSGQVWVKRGAAPAVLVGPGGWECALDVDSGGDVHLAYFGPAPAGQPAYTGTVQYAFIPVVLLGN